MAHQIKKVDTPDPNLIPIMNLFTALIPFLLMSAAFFQLSVIKISVPIASSTGETDIAKDEDKITLNLRIKSTSFDLSASSDTLPPSLLKKLKASVPRSDGVGEETKAMYISLSEAAFRIKGKYAASDTVIVVPDGEIPYEEVVAAMDAVREKVVDREGNSHRVALFPRVVLSSIIQ